MTKITADMLVFIIASFCGFKDPNISKANKLQCAEMLTNCMVIQDGYSTSKQVAACEEKYANGELK